MILVTGATGFIGSHLLPRLTLSSKVRCLVRSESSDKIVKNSSLEIVARDLSSADHLDQALQGVDCVIHLAAALRKKTPTQIRKVNVEGTQKLIEASKKNRVRRFVFVSTENVLRNDLQDAYADTKREAEQIVRSFPNAAILRPCFVYGAGDTHGLGRLVDLAQKSPFVPLFGGLTSQIQPLYVEDMVEYLIRAVQMDMRGEYIIAGPETINLNEFIKKAMKVLGLKKMTLPIPYLFYYLAAIVGDSILPAAGWGKNQLKNIYDSRTYSIEETVNTFGYTPKNLEAGLKAWLLFKPNSVQDRGSAL